jgi:RNA polymerase sigma-70 factor, ECF subfamily
MSVTPQQLYEQTLVLRSQIGDEAAFEKLIALHGPSLLLFTRKMLQSAPDQVDDITQETWLAIYRGLPGLLDAAKFKPWAFRIARDRIYREYRRRKLLVQSLDETLAETLPDAGETAFAMDAEEVQHGLALIPPEQREALVLRFFENMSYEDIARVTGCALGTVRSRIHYAKLALKDALKKI